MTADDIIKLLDLHPHPEGGHFRETFRDAADANGRSVSTAIYFLLMENELSDWHTVDAAEAWHFYAGSALLLETAETGGQMHSVQVGPDLPAGQRPQAIVPAGHWQRARSLGGWSLVGCTVAPGFEFAGFKLAPPGYNPAD